MSDKWRTGVKKTVRFWGARRVPEEKDGEDKVGEALATLSLSEQIPAGDVVAMRGDSWREQSSMSRLLEKLRRAAEVFAYLKVEKEVNDDKGVKAKEAVTQKVESIFKKPHRAAGKLTAKEQKFEEECTSEKKEMFEGEEAGEGTRADKGVEGGKEKSAAHGRREA